jgi:hypothetical protein
MFILLINFQNYILALSTQGMLYFVTRTRTAGKADGPKNSTKRSQKQGACVETDVNRTFLVPRWRVDRDSQS